MTPWSRRHGVSMGCGAPTSPCGQQKVAARAYIHITRRAPVRRVASRDRRPPSRSCRVTQIQANGLMACGLSRRRRGRRWRPFRDHHRCRGRHANVFAHRVRLAAGIIKPFPAASKLHCTAKRHHRGGLWMHGARFLVSSTLHIFAAPPDAGDRTDKKYTAP